MLMDDDQNQAQMESRQPPVEPPHRGQRPGQRPWGLILGLLAACALLAALAAGLTGPIRRYFSSDSIPDTGGTLPGAAATPAPSQSATRALPPGVTYPNAAQDQLNTCLSSFQDFMALEEIGAHQPTNTTSQDWQRQMKQAAQAYKTGCQALGNLPSAPPGYQELEYWLKQAAGEVAPITDNFNAAVTGEQPNSYRIAMDHLDKFVQYTHNAERILSTLEQRRLL